MTAPLLDKPPRSLCLIRLSALGDVTHIIPILHTLRRAWPDTQITWIVAKHEAQLARLFPGIRVVVYDKKQGWKGLRALRRELATETFDLLLMMQVSMRAHLVSRAVKAPVRLGFDKVRARDMHGLFITHRIPFVDRQHVLDGHFGFMNVLGIRERVMSWELPRDADSEAWAEQMLPGDQPTLLISGASSLALKNWTAEGYAAVADAAIERGMRVVLCGGPSPIERELGDAIKAGMTRGQPLDLIGRDTIPRFLSLLARATVLVSPDSGPAHMAAIADTPCIGVYAYSNPYRCGPYKSLQYCADGYDIATRLYLGKGADEVPWGTRVEQQGAMLCVSEEMVIDKLDHVLSDIGLH